MSIFNLPSLKQWEYALGGNSKFKDSFHKDLSDSPEDRIALFCRIFNRMALKEDSRPEFFQWYKGLSFDSLEQAEEFLGFSLDEYAKEVFIEDYLDAGKKRFPPSFILELNKKFQEIYPEEKYVKKTPIGEMAFSYMDVVEGGELESYISSYLTSFLREVQFVYKQCLKAKQEGKDYRKLPINWRDLLHKRFLIDDFASFHREYYHSNVLSEIADPFGVPFWGYVEFMADVTLNAFCKELKMDIVQTSGVPEHLYGDFEPWLNLDVEGYLLDDQVDKMTKCSIYKAFIKENGKLWEDDFVNSLG